MAEGRRVNNDKWYLFLTVFLSLISSLISAFFAITYTSKYELENWNLKRAYEVKYEVATRRVDLIEKLSQLLGRNSGMQDIWFAYVQTLSVDGQEKSAKPDLTLSEKLGDYKGEYESVLIQAGLFFGPKTRSAIIEYENEDVPIFLKDTNKAKKIVEAMYSELQYFGE